MSACNAVTFDQLISLRDGEPVDANAKAHAEHCGRCSEEIARLRSLQSALKALPTMSAPAYNAAGIRARLHSVRTYRAARVAAAAGIGALTLLLITAVNGVRLPVDPVVAVSEDAVTTNDKASPEETVGTLVIRSQELDAYLQRMPRRPHVERASTSATIDSLQSRIQWVDYQLSLSTDVGMSERQSAKLWSDRVQLMDSLLKVRYAEAQRTTMVSNNLQSSLPRSAL